MRRVTLRGIGLTEEDVDLYIVRLPNGTVQLTPRFTATGRAIFEAAAREYRMGEEEFFDFVIRSTLHWPDREQDP